MVLRPTRTERGGGAEHEAQERGRETHPELVDALPQGREDASPREKRLHALAEQMSALLTEVLDTKGSGGVAVVLGLLQERGPGVRPEEIVRALEDVPDRERFRDVCADALEKAGVMQKIGDSYVVDAEKMRVCSLDALALPNKKEQFPTYLALGTIAGLMTAFRGIPVVEKKEWDLARRKKRAPKAVSLFYDPQTPDVAFDPERIAEQEFIVAPWEYRVKNWDTPYSSGVATLSFREVALAATVFHPKFGAGVRESDGQLTVQKKDGERSRLTTDWFREAGFVGGGMYGDDSLHTPRAFLLKHGRHLLENGALRLSDFRTKTKTREGFESVIGRGIPHIMAEGIRYYVGRHDAERRFVRVSEDLYGILEEQKGAWTLTKVLPRVDAQTRGVNQTGRFFSASREASPLTALDAGSLIGLPDGAERLSERVRAVAEWETLSACATRFEKKGGYFPFSSADIIERTGLVHLVQSLGEPDFEKMLEQYDFDDVRLLSRLATTEKDARALARVLSDPETEQHCVPPLLGQLEMQKELVNAIYGQRGVERERVLARTARQGVELCVAYRSLGENKDPEKAWKELMVRRGDLLRFVEGDQTNTLLAIVSEVGVERARNNIDDALVKMRNKMGGKYAMVKKCLASFSEMITPPVPEGSAAMHDLRALYEKIRFEEYQLNEVMQRSDEKAITACIGKNDTVLDLGAGSGRLAVPLRERGFAVSAVDFVGRHVTQMKTKMPQADVREEDWTNTSFQNGAFDCVYSLGRSILHEYTLPRQTALFQEVNRLLKKDGTFLLDIPNRETGSYATLVEGYANILRKRGIKNARHGTIYDSPDGKVFATRYAYSIDDIRALADASGFRIEEIQDQEMPNKQGDTNCYITLRKVQDVVAR